MPQSLHSKSAGMREKITKCATAYALQLKYKSAGTIEFLVDDITGEFFKPFSGLTVRVFELILG